MALPPVAVEFTVEGLENVKAAFGEVSNASTETKQTVENNSKVMAGQCRVLGREIFIFAQSGRLMVEFAEQFGILEKAQADALAKGLNLISMMGGLSSSVSSLIRSYNALTATTHVATAAQVGLKTSIDATNVSATGLLATLGPLIAIAAGLAALTYVIMDIQKKYPEVLTPEHFFKTFSSFFERHFKIPSKEFGGPVYETGFYRLHAGEYVLPKPIFQAFPTETKIANVNIEIHGMSSREAESTSEVIVDRLRRAGVI